MIRLKKTGVIREVETQAEADRYIALGYEHEQETEPAPVSPLNAMPTIADVLNAKKVDELRALCEQRSITVPSGALKADIIALLLENGYVE